MVPGNHDKLLQPNLNAYHTVLSERLGMPKRPDRDVFLTSRRVAGREFVFAVVDANNYCTNEARLDASCRAHLASGSITPVLREALLSKLDALTETGSRDEASIDLSLPRTTILVIHYAADVRRVAGAAASLLLPHDCDGLQELLMKHGNRFDLVLHGHLHAPLVYRSNGVPIVSVGSLSQFASTKKGFSLLKYFADGGSLVEHHMWNGRGFVADPGPEGVVQLR